MRMLLEDPVFRHLPRADWQVLIPDHHAGFIDWPPVRRRLWRFSSMA
jgi:hypothetical protein